MVIGCTRLLLISLLSKVVYTKALFGRYLSVDESRVFLNDIADEHPMITNLYSIGKSVQGRDLLVLEVSATSKIDLGIPNVKIIGNIHGNEPVGKEIILRLAQFLVEEYKNGSKSIQQLLNSTRIHLLPTANPDGFELARRQRDYESCTWDTIGRKNLKGVDLNKNFPDIKIIQQPETESIKRWMDQIQFIASISLHSGDVVAVYPFDYEYQIDDETPTSATPDDDVFRHLSFVYAKNHPYMHKATRSCPSRNHAGFENGIINGANWYPMHDGMQDYNYLRKGCMEITIELSCCKYPLSDQLQQIWSENQKPLIAWLSEVHRGVRGIVKTKMGIGIAAILKIDGRPIAFRSTQFGEYWRILLPGVYKMKVKAVDPGFKVTTVIFAVEDNVDVPTWVNITLQPIFEERYFTTVSSSSSSSTGYVTTSSSWKGKDSNTVDVEDEIETEKYEAVTSESIFNHSLDNILFVVVLIVVLANA